MTDETKRCRYCAEPLEGKRRDARFCSSAHRAEFSRLARLIAGEPSDYPSLKARLDALRRPRHSRTEKAS